MYVIVIFFFSFYRVQHEIMSRTRTADPFLSAAGVLATAPVEHTRQESADSGLGMGNNYSLPHTPEDFLTSIDDNMDGVSGKYILQNDRTVWDQELRSIVFFCICPIVCKFYRNAV